MISDILFTVFFLTLLHKTKTFAIQLEYHNSLMQLEKEIMGDRITGFYIALDNIVGTYGICIKLQDETKFIIEKSSEIVNELEKTAYSLKTVSEDRQSLMNDHIELHELKKDIAVQKDKMVKAFKDKIGSVQKDLTTAVEEKEMYKSKQEEIDKKFVDVSEEFKKFRQKMRLKVSLSYENEEKFCKNCQKSYYEKDNYNWSCRIHASKISGDIYWCCGKVGKDSVGCIVSKHANKEDEEITKTDVNSISNRYCTVYLYVGVQGVWACAL